MKITGLNHGTGSRDGEVRMDARAILEEEPTALGDRIECERRDIYSVTNVSWQGLLGRWCNNRRYETPEEQQFLKILNQPCQM